MINDSDSRFEIFIVVQQTNRNKKRQKNHRPKRHENRTKNTAKRTISTALDENTKKTWINWTSTAIWKKMLELLSCSNACVPRAATTLRIFTQIHSRKQRKTHYWMFCWTANSIAISTNILSLQLLLDWCLFSKVFLVSGRANFKCKFEITQACRLLLLQIASRSIFRDSNTHEQHEQAWSCS